MQAATLSSSSSSPSSSSSSSLPLLSIATRVAHAFNPPTMVQGLVCHGRGVEIRESSKTRVLSRVKSQHTRDVTLIAEKNRLLVRCSCQSTTMEMIACKHVWATLLTIDRTGGLDDLRSSSKSLVMVQGPPPAVEPAAPAAPKPTVKKTTAKTDAKTTPGKPRKEKNEEKKDDKKDAKTPKKKAASAARKR